MRRSQVIDLLINGDEEGMVALAGRLVKVFVVAHVVVEETVGQAFA